MKMSIGEKKILFVFGCPNREATMDRLYQVADLIPDPAGKKVVEALADKLDSEGVEKWYRCFFYMGGFYNGCLQRFRQLHA